MVLVLTHFTDVFGAEAGRSVGGGTGSFVGFGAGGDYTQLRITSDDGLPNNRVQALAQTEDGYLWVGTGFGLARFDGVQCTTFDHSSTLQFQDNSVNALAKTAEGRLWVGTSKGLMYYENRDFARVSGMEGEADGDGQAFVSARIQCLLADPAGGLWVGTRDGLYQVSSSATTAKRLVGGGGRKGSVDIRQLVMLPGGQLLVQLPDRWAEYKASSDQLAVPTEEYTPGNVGGAILPGDDHGRRWAATGEGIFQRVGAEWKRVWSSPPDQRSQFTQITQDPDGSLWFLGGPGGVLRMRESGVIEEAFGLRTPARRASVLFIDREQVRWVGSSEGLVQLHPKRAWSFPDQQMSAVECRSLAEAPDGTIWVATAGGLDSIHGGKMRHRVAAESSGPGSVHSVAVDAAGGVWFGRDGVGLVKWMPGDVEEKRVGVILPDTRIRALALDATGALWVGTEGGVVCVKGEEKLTVAGLDSVPKVPVRAIHLGRRGEVWIGTEGRGAWLLNQGVVSSLVAKEDPTAIGHDTVLSVAGDEEGGIWFGTLDGLTYRKGTNSVSFNSKNGLKESVVHQVLPVAGPHLWVTGLRGVHRLQLEGLKQRNASNAPPLRAVTVGRADGMPSSETSGGQQSTGIVSKDGRIWVATGQGVVVIDPSLVRENTNCPMAVIESVRGPKGARMLGDQHPPVVRTEGGSSRVWLASKLNPSSRSMIEIQYTANTFVQPHKAEFEYRLLPLETVWSDPTTRRVAVYTRLTPGKYTFQVRSSNSHGYRDSKIQELDFQVRAMPHEEWWFWITVGALSSVGVGGLIRSRLRRQRESIRAEVTSLERERTRIARDLHDDVGANMTGLALKAQLAALEFPGEPSSKLQEIARDIRSLVDRMREVIWAVNPDCDTLENLVNYLTHYVEGFLTAAGCRCRLDVPAALPRLPVCAEARHNLLSVTKEALNNSVKHAEASEVLVRIAVDPTRLQLQIRDNGVGFNPDDTEIVRINGSGHGMGNMRKRIEDLRGTFTVRSSHGEGTDIVAELQLTDLAKVKNKSNGHNDIAASQRRSTQPQKHDRHSSPAQHR